MENAGPSAPKKVREELTRIKFDSLYGPIAFAANGQIDLPQEVVQAQGDKLVAVFNGKTFTAQAKYPMPAWEERQ